MIFVGEYDVSFTGAGRIILPKKIRTLIAGDTIVLSQGFDNCLTGYDSAQWESRIKGVMDASPLEKEKMDRQRFLFSSAVYIEIDGHGRIVIPKNLLQYADLTEEVTVIGVGDHFEVWNTSKWKEYFKNIKI
jgi:MraZ protein